MTTIICDATKKPIRNPRRDVNYFFVMDKLLSADAMYDLYDKVSATMARKPKYSFKEYKTIFRATLERMCS